MSSLSQSNVILLKTEVGGGVRACWGGRGGGVGQGGTDKKRGKRVDWMKFWGGFFLLLGCMRRLPRKTCSYLALTLCVKTTILQLCGQCSLQSSDGGLNLFVKCENLTHISPQMVKGPTVPKKLFMQPHNELD